ncbi:MAG TPA: hypothetical protein VJN18_18390 [Polyangiaceae bacterium]|nr:hypothetical protein [Polyangiaceae bacterium]
MLGRTTAGDGLRVLCAKPWAKRLLSGLLGFGDDLTLANVNCARFGFWLRR